MKALLPLVQEKNYLSVRKHANFSSPPWTAEELEAVKPFAFKVKMKELSLLRASKLYSQMYPMHTPQAARIKIRDASKR